MLFFKSCDDECSTAISKQVTIYHVLFYGHIVASKISLALSKILLNATMSSVFKLRRKNYSSVGLLDQLEVEKWEREQGL